MGQKHRPQANQNQEAEENGKVSPDAVAPDEQLEMPDAIRELEAELAKKEQQDIAKDTVAVVQEAVGASEPEKADAADAAAKKAANAAAEVENAVDTTSDAEDTVEVEGTAGTEAGAADTAVEAEGPAGTATEVEKAAAGAKADGKGAKRASKAEAVTPKGMKAAGSISEATDEAKGSGPVRKGLACLSVTQLTLLLVVESLLLVLTAVYVGIGIYFTSHFFFHTTLNGMDVSRMSAEEVLQMEEEEIASYVLTIECRDGSVYTISAEDFSLQELWNDAIANLVKQQNAFAWVTSLTNDTEYSLEGTIVYDADELEECLSELDFMKEENQVAAVDASISEYNALTGYTVVPSEDGTQINEDVLYEVLDAAFLALNDTVNLVESGCYIEPNITEDDETLNATVAALNAYTSTTINYEIGELSQVLDGDTIKDWLVVADDGSVSVDTASVSTFVSELSSTYNTCYSSKALATSYSETVTITNIHYGWKVDEDAEYAQILEELEAGETVTRDLNYSMTANSHTGNDYGNSYVEINLTAQHVFVYKDGALVIDTDCVSGLSSSSDRITPTGAFTLTYKQKDATLTGSNYSSHVDYWMPFYGNYGMHDASWRSSFGGTIYKTNGSHGCVNLPVSAAATIYETIDKGWPVLIYNLAGTENNTTAKNAAAKVEDLIDAISSPVTLDDEAAITKAREAYDDLSSTAKGYVDNYSTLTAAESALEELQAAASESESAASSESESEAASESDSMVSDVEEASSDSGEDAE